MQTIEVQDKRHPGWFWSDNQIIGTYGKQLGPYGIAVYMCLAYHANNGREAWPSLATIAKEVGISKRKAAMMIEKLKDLKLITVLNRTLPSGDATSNLYTLQPVASDTATVGDAPRATGIAPHATPPIAHDAIGIAPHATEQDPVNKTQLEQDSVKMARTKSRSRTPEEQQTVDQQKAIMGTYRELLAYPVANEGQENTAAKKLARLGYVPEQVAACYRHLKSDPFWKDKHLSLSSVAKQIGAYHGSNGHGPTGEATFTVTYPDGTAEDTKVVTHG